MSRQDEVQKRKRLKMSKVPAYAKISLAGGDTLTITLAEAAERLRSASHITRVDIERNGTLVVSYSPRTALSRVEQSILNVLLPYISLEKG